MKSQTVLVPDYYQDFHCIGADCEDSCCIGWSVPIDRDTYHKYKQHKHPILVPLFRDTIKKIQDPQRKRTQYYGEMQIKPSNGACAFLGEDKLCLIQKHLGEQALCHTCAAFPRQVNRFGSQFEHSLGLACPEAARRILLHPEPIEFIEIHPAINVKYNLMCRFPAKNDGIPAEVAQWKEMRMLSLAILQHRQLSLNARLMLLGLMAESMEHIVMSASFRHVGELEPVITFCIEAMQHPDVFQAQFQQMEMNQEFKLRTIGGIITGALVNTGTNPRFGECLMDALALFAPDGGDNNGDTGILARYEAAYQNYYRPFFREREYIIENYLVSEVFRRIFPLIDGTPLSLYRELICNYAIARLILIGMAGRHQGLTEESVIKLFQSFARKFFHDASYMQALLQMLKEQNSESLVHMMWLLREKDE